ncbi:hypothetical protein [Segatella salivae]|uniref:hypothetical protein n=1 Tax=Segatella salivae TaxID=228604 RepID=UPI0028F16800|nr:hypothetical protein [Segatella salivae]
MGLSFIISFKSFPRHAEAREIAFWRFRATRKHGKLLFGVSAPRGSMENGFLVFPRHAEVWEIAFWCFRATRKYEKLLFGVSAPRGSMKNCFLVLDTLYLR